MYSEIHLLKAIGMNKAQVASKLEVDVKTVTKYWEANPEQFQEMVQAGRHRNKKLKHYRNIILKWLSKPGYERCPDPGLVKGALR